MIKILIKQTAKTKVQILVAEDATPGSWGSHQLLRQLYMSLDESWLFNSPDRFSQLNFNTDFLNEMLLKHGELHCEYCGKPGLIIYPWNVKPNKTIMATADHYHPKGDNPHLAKDKSNLRVCCDKCNQKKKKEIWECKFPYPEHQ